MEAAIPILQQPILIIGDTGLLGQALMACGKTCGLDIRGASRRSQDISMDATDIGKLQAVLDQLAPKIVINAAAFVAVDECNQRPDLAYLINARLPGILASECSKRGIRLVQISTDHFFTGDGNIPHDESAPVRLVNEYARTKYAGECLALTHDDALAIRTNIVGFRGWAAPTYLEWLLGALRQEAPIALFDDFFTSSITTAQFSNALFQLLATPAKGRINLAAREGSNKLQFTMALAQACGLSTKACRRGSVRELTGAPRAESLVLDVSLAEHWLGAKLPDRNAVAEQIAKEYQERNVIS